MRDPFVGRRTLTPEQWRARGEAIQARLRGLSIDELMRATTERKLRVLARMANAEAVTIPTSRVYRPAIPTAGSGPMMAGGSTR